MKEVKKSIKFKGRKEVIGTNGWFDSEKNGGFCEMFKESGQFRCASPLVKVEKMFENLQSKLHDALQFLLCNLSK